MSDLISREKAIKWVKTECNPYGKPTLDFESGKKVIEHLKQMPSAVKHGRWKYISFLTVECSECKTQIHDLEYSNFCPNCGARMDAERKES